MNSVLIHFSSTAVKMKAMVYLAAILSCLFHSHYTDIYGRCQLSCQRPHHSLHLSPANHPLLLLKMQHTWITLQLSQLPGCNLIKQLGHLVNNQSSWKDKCRLNRVSQMMQRVKGVKEKEVKYFFLLYNVTLMFLEQTEQTQWLRCWKGYKQCGLSSKSRLTYNMCINPTTSKLGKLIRKWGMTNFCSVYKLVKNRDPMPDSNAHPPSYLRTQICTAGSVCLRLAGGGVKHTLFWKWKRWPGGNLTKSICFYCCCCCSSCWDQQCAWQNLN